MSRLAGELRPQRSRSAFGNPGGGISLGELGVSAKAVITNSVESRPDDVQQQVPAVRAILEGVKNLCICACPIDREQRQEEITVVSLQTRLHIVAPKIEATQLRRSLPKSPPQG